MSHYIPYFTHDGPRGTQRAICGDFVNPKDFSTEPDCPGCRRVLAEDEATARDLEAEFPEFKDKLTTR